MLPTRNPASLAEDGAAGVGLYELRTGLMAAPSSNSKSSSRSSSNGDIMASCTVAASHGKGAAAGSSSLSDLRSTLTPSSIGSSGVGSADKCCPEGPGASRDGDGDATAHGGGATAQQPPLPQPTGGHRVSPHLHAYDDDGPREPSCWDPILPFVVAPSTRRQWLGFLAFWGCVAGLIVWLLVWGVPKLVDNVIDPITHTVQDKLTAVQIGAIAVFAVILLPLVFVPYEPFMWVVALVFNLGISFLIVFIGT